jgi:hypothetical protein
MSDLPNLELSIENQPAPAIERVTILRELPTGNIRLELGADGTYLLFDADCLDCLPYCKAQCCALNGILLEEEEVEEMKAIAPLEFNERYNAQELRRDADGFCACLNRETRRCGIYEDRPYVCRDFHCTRGSLQRGWKLPNASYRLRDS